MSIKNGTLAVAVGSTLMAVVLAVYYAKQQQQKHSETRRSFSTTSQPSLNGQDATLTKLFKESTEVASGLEGITNGDRLMFYGLYKQATVGNVPEEYKVPSKLFIVEYAKYTSWKKFHGMTKQQAMIHYMEAVQHFASGKHVNKEEDDDGLDAFSGGMGVRVSTMSQVQDFEDVPDENNTSPEHALRQAVVASDGSKMAIESVRSCLLGANVNGTDESGQTALHFAADRGSMDCLRLLLDSGANVEAADHEGISVLQAAVIAGNAEAVKLLLEAGANPDRADMDGDTPRSCAEDDGDEEMKRLFAQTVTPSQ